MRELESALHTTKYSKVLVEEDYKYNAPHNYFILSIEPEQPFSKLLLNIHFQEGPIKECGVNGVMGEDLINIVIDRLQHFNRSEFACRENAMAITKLEEALMWLRKRTVSREQRGVEGTHTV